MLRLVRGTCDCTLVPACDSYFALTEACLARPLHIAGPLPCDDRICQRLSADECALLTALRHCPPPGDSVLMPPGIPHGLPGALCWAAYAVRRALGLSANSCGEIGECPYRAGAAHHPVARRA